ncbi:MAG: NADH dehydrogenase [Ignavibacteria bacterium RIFOXYB2_FULL_35_12]|nr:MAG: NADH dehydrogenase [Ignavibacteria bacterium GWA2_36_19]OGU53639.1 MAG: NADH dehydrogenase [Ignavibacteria bacterium GWC2_35_8]OGU62382.1 MAG: NADH dehydrogenase [Ignavibacteria bacterium GWF2_35_20]OGU79227.1 MAG: NADH dehydrogenase [Ignavibacteria bacterium RIFOXYA2_FULL_35_9]OGU86301.1 MAG: NADH dehydrogenase [Ignavibacteria bacterium RIFOXYA12_FULL_35_25]OGU87450.1 MAG: NADH dehydrogenase [Ignavibacteria bacterium RIFOXYC12_FULL_35_11]OGU97601.1 MAG: NADH dehydrogenase [Ignavibact
MDLFTAILNRRSIRKYSDKAMPDGALDKLLKSAMYAPSAMNNQAWQFVVINQRKKLDEILKVISHAEMLKSAQAAVLICGDLDLEKNIDYVQQNCSAATQNLMLCAHGLGLGSCWIGVYPVKEIISGLQDLFKLPEHIVPISLVSLGYPAENPIAEDRFKTEKVHFNQW